MELLIDLVHSQAHCYILESVVCDTRDKNHVYTECCKAGFGYHEKSSEIVLHQVTTEQGFKEFLNLKNDFPITNAYSISPEFHAFVTEEVDETLSSWFYGLVHALQFCNQVLDLKTLALHLFSQGNLGPH